MVLVHSRGSRHRDGTVSRVPVGPVMVTGLCHGLLVTRQSADFDGYSRGSDGTTGTPRGPLGPRVSQFPPRVPTGPRAGRDGTTGPVEKPLLVPNPLWVGQKPVCF